MPGPESSSQNKNGERIYEFNLNLLSVFGHADVMLFYTLSYFHDIDHFVGHSSLQRERSF